MSNDTYGGRLPEPFTEYMPGRLTLLWGSLLVLLEFLAVQLYLLFAPVTPINYWFYVLPFVWINLGLWAIVKTRPPKVVTEKKRAALMVAVGYFIILAWAGGMIARGYALAGGIPGFHASVYTVPPGWGPILLYNSPILKVTLYPYMIVGYVALAYLVYVTVLDTMGSAIGGIVGLLSCVSCTWPVLASLLSGVFGGASSVVAAAQSEAYGLSTLVFALTIVLLYYRPGFGDRLGK